MEPHLGLAFAVRGVTPVLTSGSLTDISSQTWLSFGKKPFDWLSDNQWKQLLVSDTIYKIEGYTLSDIHKIRRRLCTE